MTAMFDFELLYPSTISRTTLLKIKGKDICQVVSLYFDSVYDKDWDARRLSFASTCNSVRLLVRDE